METKVVCLALAFLVLAMEINAVPVGPSDLVEGRQPVLETKNKKINNAWLNFVCVCVYAWIAVCHIFSSSLTLIGALTL